MVYEREDEAKMAEEDDMRDDGTCVERRREALAACNPACANVLELRLQRSPPDQLQWLLKAVQAVTEADESACCFWLRVLASFGVRTRCGKPCRSTSPRFSVADVGAQQPGTFEPSHVLRALLYERFGAWMGQGVHGVSEQETG